MNRSQIENLSKEITAKYLYMLSEMSQSGIAEPFNTQSSTDWAYYIKINEISKRWQSDEKPIWEIMADLFIGLHTIDIPISIVFNCDGEKIGVYVGCGDRYIDILVGMIKGTFPQVRYDCNALGNINIFTYQEVSSKMNYGGFLRGNPTGGKNFNSLCQLDSVIQGMGGNRWNISIFARPIRKTDTVTRTQHWLTEASRCSELTQVSFSESDNAESVTYKKNYCHSEQYHQKVEAFSKKLVESTAMGEWCVAINFSSSNIEKARLLGGLLSSAFYGDDSNPEPVHAVYFNTSDFHLLTDGMEHCHTVYLNTPYPKYATLLSSKELAIYAAFPTIDTFGFSVKDYVEFDVNRESTGNLSIGNILDAGNITNNAYHIHANEFNRHCLVVGLTGSGKTNTIKSLIYSLTNGETRPIMVIEPAKKEYWELYKLGYSDLQIYSVGSNERDAHTFCLNPFERTVYTGPDGVKKCVPIQTHIDFIFSAFKASFIMYTPMPYVLERAIYSIYEDCGWDIHNDVNKNGRDIYPTIEDLYYKIPEVVIDMGYDQKMRKDLIGSLQARVNSMRLGTKGDTLNVERSFPMDKILQGNVVVELEDIGDDDVKAFIISVLLVNLLEYRRQQEDCQLEVRHLMLIEEAHRLLKNVQSGSGENADPRGAAVEFFCNLLAELRSKGQGFIVADQIPSKLAPDLIKNTNLKIVHRTVSEEERVLIGGAMHMTEAQIDSLSSLRQGVAAVYSEGDNRPKLVRSKYAGALLLADRKDMSREQVIRETSKNCVLFDGKPEYQSLTDRQPKLCRVCNSHCHKKHTDIFSRISDLQNFSRFANSLNPLKAKTCVAKKIDECIISFLEENVTPQGNDFWEDRYCLLNCLLDEWKLDVELEEKLIYAFKSISSEGKV